MLKGALKEVVTVIYILTIIHITWIRATTPMESYISLENYVRSTDSIKHKLPVNIAGNLTLLLTFRAFQIIDVDELNQSVQVLSVLLLYWKYFDIHWDPSQYNVMSLIPGIQEIACFMDLLDFPFDRHNCTISFLETTGSTVYPEMDVSHIDRMATHFIKNAEWRLERHGCGFVQVFCFQQSYLNYTECWFVMSRQRRFYLTTLLAPLVLMSAMTLLVFCLPAESGEKISFVISIFLSMTMFLSIITDVIPRSMNQIPRFLVLILVTVVVIFLAAAATVVVLNRFNKEKKQKLRGTKNKPPRTPNNQSSNQKEKDWIFSMENNVRAFQNSGEKATAFDPEGRSRVDKETKKRNKSSAWTSSMTAAARNSNRISVVSEEDDDFGQLRKTSLWTMMFCNLTHGQLDTMFFWIFLGANIIVYTWILGVYI
ncbi:unnamed protein product [Candidula unifasciata]|uniref:Neurotransmitter-gated ion-channel transmembrane domain-containing protein n=1 Tax=Candidula unifasciata TaxID=100452 RepID=A0A8S3YKD2_9EUPU|nr:unnamed protein product [Candidula unifasciata]